MRNKSLTLNLLLNTGAHFGHFYRNWNIHMVQFLLGHRRQIHILNLEKSILLLHRVINLLKYTLTNKGKILFVTTSSTIAHLVYNTANHLNQPCLINKWIGGSLTNNKELVPFFKKKLASRKQLLCNKHYLELEEQPSLIVLFNVKNNQLILEEAWKLKIPVVGFVDSDTSTLKVTYPIPLNTYSIKSIYLICKFFINSLKIK